MSWQRGMDEKKEQQSKCKPMAPPTFQKQLACSLTVGGFVRSGWMTSYRVFYTIKKCPWSYCDNSKTLSTDVIPCVKHLAACFRATCTAELWVDRQEFFAFFLSLLFESPVKFI